MQQRALRCFSFLLYMGVAVGAVWLSVRFLLPWGAPFLLAFAVTLFGVLMGYFFALAKFDKQNTLFYLILSIVVPGVAHGLFDWLLMVTDTMSTGGQIVILGLFIVGDIFLWITGVRYIKKHRESSQFKNIQPNL